MLDKREKLKIIIRECADDNQRLLAKMLGISPSTIASWIQRNTYDVELLANCIPDLSAEWLLRGEGEMLKGSVPQTALVDLESEYNRGFHDGVCSVTGFRSQKNASGV